jgi:hypothetical protein
MFDDSGFLSGSGTGQLCRLPDPNKSERIDDPVYFLTVV